MTSRDDISRHASEVAQAATIEGAKLAASLLHLDALALLSEVERLQRFVDLIEQAQEWMRPAVLPPRAAR